MPTNREKMNWKRTATAGEENVLGEELGLLNTRLS